MREYLHDSNFLAFGTEARIVERVAQLQLSFLDELQDHRGSEHFGDRTDPESVRRGQVSSRFR